MLLRPLPFPNPEKLVWIAPPLALIGIGLGTIASIAVAKGIASLLLGTEPGDPLTFVEWYCS